MTLGISFSYGFVKFVNFASIIFIFLFSVKNIEAKEVIDVWSNTLFIFIFLLIYSWSYRRLFKEEIKYGSVITKNPANKIICLTGLITLSYILLWIFKPELHLAGPTMLWLGIVLLSILLMCYYDWKLKLYLLPKKKK
ncbi:MAG: hypothetical protein ACOZAJ_00740 [Patescibacteria group bacterium]